MLFSSAHGPDKIEDDSLFGPRLYKTITKTGIFQVHV